MIQTKSISKRFGHSKQFALKNLSLDVHHGETLVLLGSSGSGKSTLLQCINRLITPTSGTILINGVDAQTLPLTQLRRSLGYVFQRIGLFPHMTLERNISIVLEIKKQPRKIRQQRAHELLELINLNPSDFARRYPDELSGGQMQRVGVARALASNPTCLLMDEPFGALDAITRNNLQDELIELKKNLKKTIVFVTHDIAEAMKLGDKIAVLHNGIIEQISTPHDLTHNPQSAFVSQLLNSAHGYQDQGEPPQ